MKSPLTGKEMVAMFEQRKVSGVEITFHYWLCTDTGEKFEDEQFAKLNYLQVINKH